MHADDPEFGYRLIAHELIHAMGFNFGENRVQRLCALQGISSTIIKRRGSGKRAGPAVHDDLVNRGFQAESINVKWVVDITEHSTAEGKIYLCAIKDCASKRTVDYSIALRMKSTIAVKVLNITIARRGYFAECMLHANRGSQFRSGKHVRALALYSMVGSMGRVGAPGDNAAMESLCSLLQYNVIDRRVWVTR